MNRAGSTSEDFNLHNHSELQYNTAISHFLQEFYYSGLKNLQKEGTNFLIYTKWLLQLLAIRDI